MTFASHTKSNYHFLENSSPEIWLAEPRERWLNEFSPASIKSETNHSVFLSYLRPLIKRGN
jgi:hypothetical protein